MKTTLFNFLPSQLQVIKRQKKYWLKLENRYIGWFDEYPTKSGKIKVFYKPYNVVFMKKQSVGMEKVVLSFLLNKGVKYIFLRIPEINENVWLVESVEKWLLFPDFEIEYSGYKQNHLYIKTIIEDNLRFRMELDKKR